MHTILVNCYPAITMQFIFLKDVYMHYPFQTRIPRLKVMLGCALNRVRIDTYIGALTSRALRGMRGMVWEIW